jgi:hypothetical protein
VALLDIRAVVAQWRSDHGAEARIGDTLGVPGALADHEVAPVGTRPIAGNIRIENRCVCCA